MHISGLRKTRKTISQNDLGRSRPRDPTYSIPMDCFMEGLNAVHPGTLIGGLSLPRGHLKISQSEANTPLFHSCKTGGDINPSDYLTAIGVPIALRQVLKFSFNQLLVSTS